MLFFSCRRRNRCTRRDKSGGWTLAPTLLPNGSYSAATSLARATTNTHSKQPTNLSDLMGHSVQVLFPYLLPGA